MSEPLPFIKLALPLLIGNWIFGLGVIQYPLGHPRPIISFFYSLTCVVFYCAASLISYPYILSWTSLLSKNLIPTKIILHSNNVLTISVIAISWWRSEGMARCFIRKHAAIETMQLFGIPFNFADMMKKFLRTITFTILFIFSMLTVIIALVLSQREPILVKIFVSITICYPVIVMFISDMTFLTSLYSIDYQFKLLNEYLSLSLTSKIDNLPLHKKITRPLYTIDEPFKPTTDDNENTKLIRGVKKIHLQLMNACNEANESHGLQILLSIMVAIAVLTGNLYEMYSMLSNDHVPPLIFYSSIVLSGIWILFYGNKIRCFSVMCSMCKESSIKIGDLVNEFYDEASVNDETKAEIRDFNIRLTENPLIFTAFRCITLDTSLIRTTISTITTYLMIMVQLGNSK